MVAAPPHFLRAMVASPAADLALFTEREESPIATRLTGAFDSATRNRGLLARDSMDPDEALIIAPCSAVHTFKMRFPIDLIYAARDGRIVKLRSAVPANRISGAWGAFAVIELAAGTIARTGVSVGDRLTIRAR
jgi:hypothetical protein